MKVKVIQLLIQKVSILEHFQGEVGWIDGVKGSALDFNGKGYVDLGLGKVKGDWTVACWVKNGTNPHTNAVLFGGSEGDIKLEQYKNTKKLGVSIYGVVDSSFDYSLPEGEWKHVAFVGDSTGTSLYVDGQYIDKVSTTINCSSTKNWCSSKLMILIVLET